LIQLAYDAQKSQSRLTVIPTVVRALSLFFFSFKVNPHIHLVVSITRTWKYTNAQKQHNSWHLTHLQYISQQPNVFQAVLGFRCFLASVVTDVCTATWWDHLSTNQITIHNTTRTHLLLIT